jgi:hypothetical protein
MLMKAGKIEFEIKIKTRKIIYLTKKLNGENLTDLYFKSMKNCNVEALATIILAFAEYDFKDIDEVSDFIDDYMIENKKTYTDIYMEIAEVVNKEGFFDKKMTKEELKEKSEDLMSTIDMGQIVETATKEVAKEMATNSFNGYES